MNRRRFLSMLGLAPLIPLAGKVALPTAAPIDASRLVRVPKHLWVEGLDENGVRTVRGVQNPAWETAQYEMTFEMAESELTKYRGITHGLDEYPMRFEFK